MMIFLKLTNTCNLRCSFCYVKDKTTSILEEMTPREVARILKEKLFDYISEDIHLVLHGGEFSLYSFDKLKELLFEIRRNTNNVKCVSAMSNLSSRNMSRYWRRYLSYGIGLSTSFNDFVATKTWLENIKKIARAQGFIHVNRVFTREILCRSRFIDVHEKLVSSIGKVILKYERFVDPEKGKTGAENDAYRLASDMMLSIFEKILEDYNYHNLVFPFTYQFLLFAFAYKHDIKLPIRGMYCSPMCAFNCAVVDSSFDVAFCTKKFNETKIGNLLDEVIYQKDIDKVFLKKMYGDNRCYECRLSKVCLGPCHFVETFDSTGECAQSREVIEYLLDLPSEIFDRLIESNQFMKNMKDNLRSLEEDIFRRKHD